MPGTILSFNLVYVDSIVIIVKISKQIETKNKILNFDKGSKGKKSS